MSTVQLAFCVLIGVMSFLLYKLKRHMSHRESRAWHYDDIFKAAYEKHKGCGPFAGFYFYLNPSVLALELELIRQVLISDLSKFAAYNEMTASYVVADFHLEQNAVYVAHRHESGR